ncbi:UvrD-helicase domain-containing protein [Thioalkalivibrio sp. ALgr3]|uniref:UvrD-helicase domain-containing protein n=1 Tax=Thioalkalivibrio sp. ALgr3 TaxID=1239292 RepID=UPI00037ECCE3|nr:UvrD-helicase domain-containing protein [Thioalkalivibrio sp. ALgr3]
MSAIAQQEIRPTPEQQAIIDAPEDRDIAVSALAGAAKTTTLELRAKAHPNQKILYVALNKAVQQEAAQRFPSNVTCKTTHALAFRTHGVPFKDKLGNLRPFQVKNALRLSMRNDEAMVFAALCAETVKRFCASPDEQITESHVPAAKARTSGFNRQEVRNHAADLWGMMQDTSRSDVPMTHDGYLKLYQLSQPDLSSQFDAIYLDEAQDTNPAMYAIFSGQTNMQRVAVGDRNQSIYRFRGSMDVMSEMVDAEPYSLTGSFRFGAPVAYTANVLLGLYLGESLVLEGLGGPTRLVPSDDSDIPLDHRAYLCRTNAGLFDQAVELLDQGYERLCWLGGIESYGMETLMDVHRLSVGQHSEIKDRLIRSFRDLEELKSYADEAEDIEISVRVKVVEKYGRKLPRKVEQLRRTALDRAIHGEPLLTTAHRSKGSEFAHVILGEDFPAFMGNQSEPLQEQYPLIESWMPRDAKEDPVEADEVFLAYVAATRAQQTLGVNKELAALLRWWKQVGSRQAA